MAYLLRKFSLSKWQNNLENNHENYEADAITGCTRTKGNTLSVWQSATTNFDDDEVKDLIVALAISMDEPATIDVLWLEENWLAESGLEIESKLANTKFSRINDRHKDLVNLDHSKLGIMAHHIVNQAKDTNKRKKFLKSEVIELVATWSMKEDTFHLEQLKPKWQEAVTEKIKRMNDKK
ncbi:hypothetical protein FJD32_000795 [Shewanella sp. LC6]|jgi:hypothetical protein|uniref:hypothetical protein n=1 Tax=Shewanella TaxID=22 RepID=UPI0006DBCB85|nr:MULTISPECIES: hypothetical protein [Shewanella]ASF16513.1 hypothetical protein CEQ32_16905 [Shewanella sp. FDAARGOS_354]KPN77234.1 hypothetical protein AEA42_09585 [Shewanella sp. Sh95]MDH1468507.1 hypothetical protein [Shewanella sp. GD03713]ODR85097.1 hypothetical protein ABT47_07140 [Shewanella xiamenensis]QQK58160.1 hypothetical protein FJD32_000795 [Shewanella sp. LC6]